MITIDHIKEVDDKGLLEEFDDEQLGYALRLAMIEVEHRCGHDFGSYDGSEDIIDSTVVGTLYLRGRTRYPLRIIDSVEIYRGTPEDGKLLREYKPEQVVLGQYEPIGSGIDGVFENITFLEKPVRGDRGTMFRINGLWGWGEDEIPHRVKMAVLNLVLTVLEKAPDGMFVDTSAIGNVSVRRLRRRDGTEIEFFDRKNKDDDLYIAFYDKFAFNILDSYRWKRGWAVI